MSRGISPLKNADGTNFDADTVSSAYVPINRHVCSVNAKLCGRLHRSPNVVTLMLTSNFSVFLEIWVYGQTISPTHRLRGENISFSNFEASLWQIIYYIKPKMNVQVEKVNLVKVPGKNKRHKVLVYALSTCAWCKLTKQFLKENEIEYEYIDVDLSSDEDKEKIRKDILERKGDLSYPAIMIDGKILINGFRKDKLREILEV
jgi:glutaredoxin